MDKGYFSGLNVTIAAGVAALCVTAGATAGGIEPSFDVFGELPEATWGGTGIPNDNVAITTIIDGGNTITLGLASHGRFSETISNDGAGTFTAAPGLNTEGSAVGAKWNFNFFIDIEGGGTFADYEFELKYDFDPAANTPEDDHGVLNFNDAIDVDPNVVPSDLTRIEGSQNLNFGFLADNSLPFITAPGGSFDPFALGEYSFGLFAYDADGNELGHSGIHVQVVPLPAPVFLGAAGLAGVVIVRRRYKTA